MQKTKKPYIAGKAESEEEMKEKIVKMLLELPPGVLQDINDYGCLAILVVVSIICILLGKLVYKRIPIVHLIYKIYVIAIDVIVLVFSLLYKYSKK